MICSNSMKKFDKIVKFDTLKKELKLRYFKRIRDETGDEINIGN